MIVLFQPSMLFMQKLIPFSEVYQADSWGHLIWLGTEGKSVSQKVISF